MNKTIRLKSKNILFLTISLCLISCSQSDSLSTLTNQSAWYQDGVSALELARSKTINNNPGSAKNIILFVGDGMSMTTVTAARIYAGQQQQQNGEEYQLSFEKFPWTGLSKTYNTNQQTPDSAGTMTAMMTGVKTRAGVISVSEEVERASCENYQNLNSPDLMSALKLAEIAGKATGIVTTARLTHATPAAAYANSAERNWEAQTPSEDCLDIASQFINFSEHLKQSINSDDPEIDGIDIAFGGGRAMFFDQDPESIIGFSERANEGRRNDGQNLIQQWTSKGGAYVMDRAGFSSLNDKDSANILGLFNDSHMLYESDRKNDRAGEPSLTEMTLKAIDILEEDSDGFFLVVEAGRIDHAHHANNAYNALSDTLELSEAVAASFSATKSEETLIIVTADHSHVLSMSGYPTRGNPILGKVISNDNSGNPQTDFGLDETGMPYTTLTYANGRGFADYQERTDGNYETVDPSSNQPTYFGRMDLSEVDTERPGFHQETLIPLAAETHGGEDVPIYASGPGAHLISGNIEQNVIFHVMNYAGNLEKLAIEKLK